MEACFEGMTCSICGSEIEENEDYKWSDKEEGHICMNCADDEYDEDDRDDDDWDDWDDEDEDDRDGDDWDDEDDEDWDDEDTGGNANPRITLVFKYDERR